MDEALGRLLSMVDDSRDELVRLHQDMVRIPTVNTGAPESGHETELCRYLQERFEQEGISAQIVESAPGRGNFIAHIGGKASPRLMLMSHLDVVPIEDESQWNLPPFAAKLVEGRVYGRGSSDCKSYTSSQAMAMFLLKRAGVRLNGELRILAAADEESGGFYGIVWLAKNLPGEIRADWAVNEGGGTSVRTNRGLGYLLCVGEKGRMQARFAFQGRSAHAARPWAADNTLYKMAELLERLQNYKPELDVSAPLFQHLSLFGIQEPVTVQNVDRIIAALAPKDQALAVSLMGMSRITITPTMASAGVKSNSIPARASLTCDIRTLPHQDKAYVQHELVQLIAGIAGTTVEVDVWAVSNASPYGSPFVENLKRATEDALGGRNVTLLPALAIGFTDSRCVRPLGAQVYGFGPAAPGSDANLTGVHGINEFVEIETLVTMTKAQLALAYLTLAAK